MSERQHHDVLDGIAIVGLGGRFPGAPSVAALWQNLCAGVESIAHFSADELRAAGIDPALIAAPNYVKARGALRDADAFDAAFFAHSPAVAALMDPQHRLFLECAWSALEHAAIDPARSPGPIGVFAGSSMNTYLLTVLAPHLRFVASVESLQAAIGNDKDSLTSEVAYKFNLTGPSVTIQSSSSTSLVAVHVACQSLLNVECDLALAGGVSIHFPEIAGYLYQEGGATSPDGHCRAFDAHAQGFVNGHGAGVVVLARLADARRWRLPVYAVILGSAVNNDGAHKVSYMAPSVEGQAQVIALAQALAGVAPDQITYVEAHGTATPLGDPIEVAALTQAFRRQTARRQFCVLGSLKPNIGHLDSAAGVAGLIKASLALHERCIPPTLHYTAPNPQIDFAASPFYVTTQVQPWTHPPGVPRRAGVSSFGMGGTNAHVVLEEAPPPLPSDAGRPWQVLVLSAKSASALHQRSLDLAAYVAAHPQVVLADVAYTLQLGRQAMRHRQVVVGRDAASVQAALATGDAAHVLRDVVEEGSRGVVFLCSGQGSQYVGMGQGVYATEAVFRAALDECARLAQPHLGLDLRTVLFAPADEAATARLRETWLAQPALFAVEYALAQQWMAWGVRPTALIGHSIGEYVAACLAGVLTLADALAVVVARGRLMDAMPRGAMVAVPLSRAAVEARLGRGLDVAAENGPTLCVVAGGRRTSRGGRRRWRRRGWRGDGCTRRMRFTRR